MAVPISNAILIHSLTQEIPRSDAKRIGAHAVIKASANLKALTNEPIVLRALRYCYVTGIRGIMIFSLVAVVVSLPFAICTEWKRIKTTSSEDQSEGEGA